MKNQLNATVALVSVLLAAVLVVSASGAESGKVPSRQNGLILS